MTTYYAGVGGNDANNGTSYALRKLTIQAAVNLATTAGDQVMVSPGTYRETVTLAASGSGGSPISLIGDYTGANTSGARGVVRITGSNDDITATRSNCIAISSKSYLVIQGFTLDGSSSYVVSMSSAANVTIKQCHVGYAFANTSTIYCSGASQTAVTISECVVHGGTQNPAIYILHSSGLSDVAHVIQNCLIVGPIYAASIRSDRVGGVTVKNCTIRQSTYGVAVQAALTGGQTVTVNNCILDACYTALQAVNVGEITEDYNTLPLAVTARVNVTAGANSVTRPPLFGTRWFHEAVNSGKIATPFDLASYSTLVEYNSGTGAPSTDMRGAAATGTYREWGALEYNAALAISGGGGAVPLINFGSGMQVG